MAKSIAVLVGKVASKIRFNHNIKLRRAINAETLERMVDKVDFAIIEEINAQEEEQIKVVIGKFKHTGKPVYFFPSTDDEVTMGVADELEYSIYNNLRTLCSVIESEQNIKVAAGFGLNLVENDVDSSNDFGQTIEMSEAIKELEEADLAKKNDEPATSEERFTGFSDYTHAGNTDEKDERVAIPEITPEELSAELEDLPESVSNEINRLKMQLSDLNYDYSLAVEDMRVATERICNLEKIITTLKDEKECMQAEFNSILQTNDVLEDPISLSTYQKTVDELKDRDKQVEELNAQVVGLKQTVEKDKATISEKMAEISDLTAKLSEIEDELGNINDSIASGEIHKDIVAEFTEKLENIKNEKDEAVKEANELKIKASTDASTIGLLNKNLALETQYRYTSVEMFIELIDTLNNKINELNDALIEKSNIENKLTSSEETGSQLTSDLDDAKAKINELSKLEGKLAETEKELDNKKSELEDLQAKLSASKESLTESARNLAEKDEELNKANEQISELNAMMQKNAEDNEANLKSILAEKDKEYQEARSKYIEDAARVLENLKYENKDTLDRLNNEIKSLKEKGESSDEKIKEQEEKIASLQQTADDNSSTIEDLNSTIESLNGVIDTKDAQLNAKDEQLNEKTTIIDNLNESVENKDKTIKAKDYAILEKDRELAAKADDIKALNASLEAIESKHAAEVEKQTSQIEELKKKIDELNESITSKEYTIGVQSVAIEERENDIEQLKGDIEVAKKNSALLEEKVKRADERFKNTLERLKVSGGDIEKLMADAPGGLSQEDIDELKAKLNKSENELGTANFELEKLKSDYATLSGKYNESVQQLSESTKSLTSKTEEATKANITIQQLKSKVEQLENEVKTLESVKNGASSDEVDAIKNQNSTLVEKNSALTEQLNEYLASDAANKRLLSRMESEIETYKSLVAELQSDAGNVGSQCTIGSIKYNRGAQIISIFGNRSCGITTLAVSVARKLSLNTNVLYIDFDMIAPKGDVIFKKTPIVSIRGVKNTSLGAMSAFSSNLTASEIKSLAIDVEKTKGGRLDYFSGYHYKPADNVIAVTDFQKMFDTLGEHYDYIIIDLGKIGASTFNNSIIKEIVNISNKSIAISNHDLFNIKAMLRTLNIMSINSKDVAWAINKVPENQVGTQSILSLVNSKIMESLADCKVGAFADDLKLRGLPLDFSAGSRSNKINFEMFLAQTVFG